jgi:hypothetical protein
LCRDRLQANKERKGTDALSQHNLAEQKKAGEAFESHQGKSFLRGTCYTGTAGNTISP